MSDRLELAAWACVAVLSLASSYEALVALEVIPLGNEPGADAALGDLFLVGGLAAGLVGAVASSLHVFQRAPRAAVGWVALAPAGLAFALARWLTFDPYYLPAHRRYSQGEVHGWWIAFLGVAAAGAAVLAWRAPRAGAAVTAVTLVASAFTAWIVPIGK